jgi:hypothetical protein
MKVSVQIFEEDVEGDYTTIDGLRVACERCGHEVIVCGASGASARFAALRLSGECPQKESNYYDVDWWG